MNHKLPRQVDDESEGRNSTKGQTAQEALELFGIMSEFVEATDRLSQIRPAVSVFGSARIPPDHAYYMLAEQISRKLSDAGFSVISGGGPGFQRFFRGSYTAGTSVGLPVTGCGRDTAVARRLKTSPVSRQT